MKLGIVGLPNVGKSTLFNAITQAGAESANYPFCTIEPNVGVVAVPDHRLNVLRDLYQSEKVIPAAIEFYDIAGLVRGASKGEGLGNKFLSHIREVSSILHVVRCFEDSNITHVDGNVNPLRDIETINLELVFSDLEMVEKRIQKQEKLAKSDKSLLPEVDLLKRIKETLEEGKSVRTLDLTDEENKMIKDFNLLSSKPIIYVTNVDENDIHNLGADNPHVAKVKELAATENAEVVTICAKIEAEISELEEDEKQLFLEELGLKESGLDRLIKASYSLLGLISYLTAGPKEVRAWTIKNGLKAPQAAGKIHTDFERGFIRAEIVAYDDLISSGSYSAAKEKGLVRLEGKEYIVKDGDVILFRFNV
ncbi:redox-regulated ATPase YchF [Alkaliphilus transvaalensis]|uniref:redox-regulated ATPase YchF n=1 Tax=Alkaliphilus transvaalensis TaxID=114628 RepID=UPI0004799FEB|nr:redox-regulated ATPase YchF [Alkaliphilus transvaalensis]